MDQSVVAAIQWISSVVGQAVAQHSIERGLATIAADWVDRLTEECSPELYRFNIAPSDFADWLSRDDIEVLLNAARPSDVETFVEKLTTDFPDLDHTAGWAIAGSVFTYFLTTLDATHASAVLAERIAALHITVDEARAELLAAGNTVISLLSMTRVGLVPPPIDDRSTLDLIEAIGYAQSEIKRLVDRSSGGGLQVDWRGHFAQSTGLRPAHILFAASNTSASDLITIRSIEVVVDTYTPSDQIHHVYPEGVPKVYRYKVTVTGPNQVHEVIDKAKMHVLRPFETDVFDIEVRAPEGIDVILSLYLTWNTIGEPGRPSRDLVKRVAFRFGTFSASSLLDRVRSLLASRQERG